MAHQLVSRDVPGEQCRQSLERVIERASERAGIVDDLLIGLFREGHTEGTMPPRRPRRATSGHEPPPFEIYVDQGRFVSLCQQGTAPLQNP